MSNVDEMRWRLLCEQVLAAYRTARRREADTFPTGSAPDANTEILLRLAGAVLALLDWHAIDSKGRCRVRGCTRRGWPPWRKRRTCLVFVTMHFWISQPIAILRKIAPR